MLGDAQELGVDAHKESLVNNSRAQVPYVSSNGFQPNIDKLLLLLMMILLIGNLLAGLAFVGMLIKIKVIPDQVIIAARVPVDGPGDLSAVAARRAIVFDVTFRGDSFGPVPGSSTSAPR